MKKIVCFIVLLFILNSCGTDYFYSSFTIRRELLWFATLADQETLDTRAQMVGYTTTFNRFSSPSIIATPANYLVAVYENRTISTADLDVYGINGRKKTEVTARISKDSSSFNNTVTVGNTKGLDPTVSHGSPVSFLTKDGSIVVLSTGGAGFAQNYASQKTTISVSISSNNGYDWTTWKDLDEKVFEPLTKNSYDRFYTTPGNGKTLRNGTLVCMIDYKRDTDASAQGAAILYSKDDGTTWQLGGTLTYNNGHRFAKIIAERTDGKLLIAAVKNTDKNDIGVYNQNNVGSIAWYLADTLDSNITSFSGVTSPVVQDPVLGPITLFSRNNGGVISGDRIKYSHKGIASDGILLVHSYPEHKFKEAAGTSTVYNVTALSISADDGKTWTMITNVVGKEGTNLTSFRHSGLVVFRDGSIGIAYEEGIGPTFKERQGFIPYYRRFGLSAISGGVYSYEGL